MAFVSFEKTSSQKTDHKAHETFNGLIKFLNIHDIDLQCCGSQSYHSAFAMKGKFNGLQAKVTAENKFTEYPASATLFDFLEKIYVFVAGPTNRSYILTETMKSSDSFVLVLKEEPQQDGLAKLMAIKPLKVSILFLRIF